MDKIKIVVDALEGVNLSDIVVYDMREKSPFFDYMVISSATSDRQLNASISHIQNALSENGFDVANIEGKNSNSWVLIDCKDIIVNVFTKEERVYYNLEKMLAEIEELDLEKLREL
jgi:ribosome-associated protein